MDKRRTETGRRPESAVRPPRGISTRGVVLVVLLLVLAGVLTPFVRAWVAQENRIEALEADIEAREQRVADLQLADQRWQDPNYITTQARKRFTYVMPGEVGYVVLDTPRVVADKANPSGAAARAAAGSDNSWVSTIWGSVEEAGQASAGAEADTEGDGAK